MAKGTKLQAVTPEQLLEGIHFAVVEREEAGGFYIYGFALSEEAARDAAESLNKTETSRYYSLGEAEVVRIVRPTQ